MADLHVEFDDARDSLTDVERSEFSEIVRDGFFAYGLVENSEENPLGEYLGDPFWGARLVPAPEDITDREHYVADMKSQGMSRQDAMKQYKEVCAEVLRPWRQLNSFRTNEERLENWLFKRLADFFGDSIKEFTPFVSSSELSKLIERVRPFSMVWFELWILRGLLHASELEDDADNGQIFGNRVSEASHNGITTGRLIEAYRWRFVYGSHALRGQKVIQSAANGGRLRSQSMRAKSEKVLNEISKLVEHGHSLSRAAEIAASRGFGMSKNANRKLWYRHSKT